MVHAELILKRNWLVSPWGEPDVRLFDLGASYAEIKPSELLRRQMEAAGCIGIPSLRRKVYEKTKGTPRPARCLTPPSNKAGPSHFR